MTETTEKSYELRALTAKDIFPVCAIVDKIGVKEFRRCLASADVQKAIKNINGTASEDDLYSVGLAAIIDIAGVIISHISSAENEIFTFLESMSGIAKKDLKDIAPAVFAQMIIDIVKKDEFKDFFSVVLGFLK